MHGFLLKCSCSCKTKVTNLYLVVFCQENVCWLKVSMYNFFGVNISQTFKNPSNNLYFNLFFFKPCCDKLFQCNAFHKLHDNVKNLKRKQSLFIFILIWRLVLKRNFRFWLYRNRLPLLLKLYFTVVLKMNVIFFLKHDIVILNMAIKQFQLLSFIRMVFKKYLSFGFAPILINMLQLLFLLRLCYWHIIHQFIHATNILQPRLMISNDVWMVESWEKCYLI